MTEGTGRRSSRELTEIRTVLSRAESGIAKLEGIRRYGFPLDRKHEEIEDDLRTVVALLGKYRRTGRTPRK